MSEKLKELHKLSSKHRDALEESGTISCFHCLEDSSFEEIEEWIDWQDTALCPKCGIDACLPKQDEEILIEMNDCYFNYVIKYDNEGNRGRYRIRNPKFKDEVE